MLRLRTFLPILVAPLLVTVPAAATCDSGAPLLLVPEDCASVKAAVTAVASGGTIDVASGTAPLGASPLSLSNLGKALTIRARGGAGSTVFSGGGTSPIVRIENSSAGNGKPIVFEGIRFANGRSIFANRAGGVTLVEAKVSFVDCFFDDNEHVEVTTGGGALAVLDGSEAFVIRSRFDGNTARNNGGAIYAVRNPGWDPVTVWIHDSEFVGNSTALSNATSTSAGGAIYLRDAAARIADSRFEGNLSGWLGGAIYGFGNWIGGSSCDFTGGPATDLLVTRSSFLENRADDALHPDAVPQTLGGALHVERCVRARLWSSLFDSNEADWGGAISLGAAQVEIDQSVLRHNRTTVPDTDGGVGHGGAIVAVLGPEADPVVGELTIDRTFLEGGTAADPGAATASFGGCMLLGGSAAHRMAATLRETVFYGCHAGPLGSGTNLVVGGAIDAGGADLTVEDSLFLGSSTSGPSHAAGAVAVRLDSRGAFTNVVMAGSQSVFERDLLVESENSSVSSWPEEWTELPPSTAGMVVAVPGPTAPGGPMDLEAHLAWAWRGSSATLDGASLPGSPGHGWQPAAVGAHTLAVAGLAGCGRCATVVAASDVPSTTLGAGAIELASGQSTTLSWATPGGDFEIGFLDRGLTGAGVSGAAGTGPLVSSTSFRRVAYTREGGALAEIRIYVDEPALEPLFADDFDLGTLEAWSSTVGG